MSSTLQIRSRAPEHRRWLRAGPGERRTLLSMAAVIVALHLVGFGLLFGVALPSHLPAAAGHQSFTVGVGLLAYTFGLRHAFDADHIAAVDNTTRKLLADRAGHSTRRPLTVGFWFSLGHSTVVFALTFLLSFGVKALAGQVEDGSSTLRTVTGVIGPSVSGAFLWVLGLWNLAALVGIMRMARDQRSGRFDEDELERRLERRGLISRLLGGVTTSVREPWHIYPVGVLFGLGFDTATEVGLLVLAVGAAAVALPLYAILVLPLLFAAGMCLMDTIDGVFMNVAYGWALSHPARKLFYNVTTTTLSIAAALTIGTIELAGVITAQAGIEHGPIASIAAIRLDYAGYGIVAMFVVGWVAAITIWRLSGTERRFATAAFKTTASEPGTALYGTEDERSGDA